MKILVTYYSMYGHVYRLAQEAVKALGAVEGVEPVIRRAAEFEAVSKVIEGNDYLRQLHAEQSAIPVATPDDFRQAGGYLFGSPTRFGNMAAQMKQVFDTLGGLWMEGAMEGKPAGVFTFTASTHGGQETTCISMYMPLIHLGTLIVGVPYSTPGLAHTEAHGGSPYGASTIAGGRGELQPTEQDLLFMRTQAERVARIALKLQ